MRLRALLDGGVAACLVLMLAAPVAVLAATPDAAPAPVQQPLPTPDRPPATLVPIPAFGSAAGRAQARQALGRPEELRVALDGAFGSAFEPAGTPAYLLTQDPYGIALRLVEPRPRVKEPAGLLDLVGLLLVVDAHGLLYGGSAAAQDLMTLLPVDTCPVAVTALFLEIGMFGLPEEVASATAVAQRLCPGDLTPLVLRTLWTLENYGEDSEVEQALAALAQQDQALALVLRADHLLRQADAYPRSAPFRTRRLAAEALRHYDAVAPVLPAAALGAAEALHVLGRHEDAVQRLRRLLSEQPTSRLAPERLAAAEERAGRPDAAARLLGALPGGDGTRLFPGGTETDPAGLPGRRGSQALGLLDAVPATLGRPSGRVPATGVTVQDFSFVPRWRAVPGLAGAVRGCAPAAEARAALAAGLLAQAQTASAEAACASHPARFARALAEAGTGAGPDVQRAAVAEEARREEVTPSEVRLPDAADDLQELQRYAGRLEAAAETVARWGRRAAGDPLPLLRQAELAFLQEDWPRAVERAQRSAALAQEPSARGRALLVAGAAQGAAGQDAAALRTLTAAADLLDEVGPPSGDPDLGPLQPSDAVAAYVLFEVELARGNLLLRTERYADAEQRFRSASQAYEATSGAVEVDGARPELALVGQALAALGDGRPEQGVEAATQAVESDPDNALFLLDLAFVQRRDGDLAAAERSLRRARAADPRLGVAALDLGTLLAEQGRDEEAQDVLRRAVDLEPASAPGWHTLGVVLSRGGPRDLLQAQAAFARAAREDKDFRGRERVPLYDDRIYVSRLDLSKPLPPEWSFSTTEQRLPGTALAVVMAIGLVAWMRGRYVGAVVDVVEARSRRLLEGLRHVPAQIVPVAAVAGTLTVLLAPVVRARLPLLETAVLGAGIALLLLAVVLVRQRVAPVPVRHVAWTPALVVGVAGAATGLGGYAPVPAAAGTGGDPRVHRAAPLLLFCLGMTLLVLATLTEVPATRVLATSALAMAAVCLTPAGPYDGPHVAAPRALRVVGLLGTAVALGLAVGLL